MVLRGCVVITKLLLRILHGPLCKCIILIVVVILLSGGFCEEDIDECKLNVCKHGHCLNSDGEFTSLIVCVNFHIFMVL